MVEKFSDFESVGFLGETGTFEFEITNAELKQSQSGNDMVVFECKSDAGSTRIHHSLSPKARWSYNNLIKACLNLDTKEKIENFMCDYMTIHQKLIGTKFVGDVVCETYEKAIKIALDDGTFEDGKEIKEAYRINAYHMVGYTPSK